MLLLLCNMLLLWPHACKPSEHDRGGDRITAKVRRLVRDGRVGWRGDKFVENDGAYEHDASESEGGKEGEPLWVSQIMRAVQLVQSRLSWFHQLVQSRLSRRLEVLEPVRWEGEQYAAADHVFQLDRLRQQQRGVLPEDDVHRDDREYRLDDLKQSNYLCFMIRLAD